MPHQVKNDDVNKLIRNNKSPVFMKKLSLFESNISKESADFLKMVEGECKKRKSSNPILIVIT